MTLLLPHTSSPLFATQSSVEASAIAMGREASLAFVSDPLAAGRRVNDIKTSFLTDLVAQLLVLLSSRNLLA